MQITKVMFQQWLFPGDCANNCEAMEASFHSRTKTRTSRSWRTS